MSMPLWTPSAKPTPSSVDHFGAVMPGLEDLYREIILDHYRNPRNRGELESPPALRRRGFQPPVRRRSSRLPRRRRRRNRRPQDLGPGLLDLAVIGVDDVRSGQGQDRCPGPLDDQGLLGDDVAPRPAARRRRGSDRPGRRGHAGGDDERSAGPRWRQPRACPWATSRLSKAS